MIKKKIFHLIFNSDTNLKAEQRLCVENALSFVIDNDVQFNLFCAKRNNQFQPRKKKNYRREDMRNF